MMTLIDPKTGKPLPAPRPPKSAIPLAQLPAPESPTRAYGWQGPVASVSSIEPWKPEEHGTLANVGRGLAGLRSAVSASLPRNDGKDSLREWGSAQLGSVKDVYNSLTPAEQGFVGDAPAVLGVGAGALALARRAASRAPFSSRYSGARPSSAPGYGSVGSSYRPPPGGPNMGASPSVGATSGATGPGQWGGAFADDAARAEARAAFNATTGAAEATGAESGAAGAAEKGFFNRVLGAVDRGFSAANRGLGALGRGIGFFNRVATNPLTLGAYLMLRPNNNIASDELEMQQMRALPQMPPELEARLKTASPEEGGKLIDEWQNSHAYEETLANNMREEQAKARAAAKAKTAAEAAAGGGNGGGPGPGPGPGPGSADETELPPPPIAEANYRGPNVNPVRQEDIGPVSPQQLARRMNRGMESVNRDALRPENIAAVIRDEQTWNPNGNGIGLVSGRGRGSMDLADWNALSQEQATGRSVAAINKDIAAVRDLRNAQRAAEGTGSVGSGPSGYIPAAPTMQEALQSYASGDVGSQGYRMIRNLMMDTKDTEKVWGGKDVGFVDAPSKKAEAAQALLKGVAVGAGGGGRTRGSGPKVGDFIDLARLQNQQGQNEIENQRADREFALDQRREQRQAQEAQAENQRKATERYVEQIPGMTQHVEEYLPTGLAAATGGIAELAAERGIPPARVEQAIQSAWQNIDGLAGAVTGPEGETYSPDEMRNILQGESPSWYTSPDNLKQIQNAYVASFWNLVQQNLGL